MIAVVLCVVSAAAYAVGAVWQQRVADLPFLRQARHPRFWSGAAANFAGMGLHILALRYGSLVLVQSLGVLTLVLAVATRGRHAGRPEVAAAVATAAGLAGLLASLGTTGAAHPVALTGTRLAWLLVAAAVVLGAVSLASLRPGLHTALGGGVTFGVASAVTQTVVLNLAPVAIAALCVLQPLGIWLTQLGYRRGLAAPLAAHTVANPVTAAVIGIVLLGQTVAHPLPAALCAAVVVSGIVVLAATTRPTASAPVPPPPAAPVLPAQALVSPTSASVPRAPAPVSPTSASVPRAPAPVSPTSASGPGVPARVPPVSGPPAPASMPTFSGPGS
ncbi:hypothetical protein [Actinoplanes sp. NPDC049265]|uniref:hypothetical protein n=1 Tax=Actinoplanes sp. NPDC049265 TaxID=3363902 RepID=UPI00371FE5BA